jgi:hypothetical protein
MMIKEKQNIQYPIFEYNPILEKERKMSSHEHVVWVIIYHIQELLTLRLIANDEMFPRKTFEPTPYGSKDRSGDVFYDGDFLLEAKTGGVLPATNGFFPADKTQIDIDKVEDVKSRLAIC